MIDVELYLKALGLEKKEDGAQELILAEIIGCLDGCKTIWLPYGGKTLCETLKKLDFEVIDGHTINNKIDAMYFGTPTIVDNKMLFTGQFKGKWTKDIERKVTKNLCSRAIKHDCECIVSGLGEGDISLIERLNDIESSSGLTAKVAALKKFNGFIDIVIKAVR
jgi:hypothetical protein